MDFYNPPKNWPTLEQIHSDVEFKEYIKDERTDIILDGYSSFFWIILKKIQDVKTYTYKDDHAYFSRYAVIFTTELLLLHKNNKILINNPSTTKIFNMALFKLKGIPELNKYSEHLRYELDDDYRLKQQKLWAKRRYIELIFRQSDLGFLIAKNIADLYTDD